MAQIFPLSWGNVVKSIALCQTNEDRVFASYHPKEKAMGIYWPREPDQSLSKTAAIDVLLVAMAAVVDKGELPD